MTAAPELEPAAGAQAAAPYLDALAARGLRAPARFHVPGHHGGPGADGAFRRLVGETAFLLDQRQNTPGVDLGAGATPYARAEALAAALHGARRTWFLTNGATQGNHALCLALAVEGASVAVQRNSHASVVDGLVLSGGAPVWITPERDGDLGVAGCATPAALHAALAARPGTSAAFVVSPTYYGMVADIAACAAIAHEAGALLVADQSWGPHFGFHPELPPSALACGADAVLTSTHKLLGSLSQSAMVHVAGERIDPLRVERAVRLVRSTSQSTLLLASLDAARRQLAVHGRRLLDDALARAAALREAVERIPGCRVACAPQGGMRDPLRVVVDVRGTGRRGDELARVLRAEHDVEPELATPTLLVLVLGLGLRDAAVERLVSGLADAVARPRAPVPSAPAVVPATRAPSAPVRVLDPRAAFLRPHATVPFEQAVGAISAEAIAGYPPGIATLLPGERIDAGSLAELRALQAAGARLHGASDPTLRTLRVVAETSLDELESGAAPAPADEAIAQLTAPQPAS